MPNTNKDVEQRFAGYLNQVEASRSIFLPLYPPDVRGLAVAATESVEDGESSAQHSFDGAIV